MQNLQKKIVEEKKTNAPKAVVNIRKVSQHSMKVVRHFFSSTTP